MVSLCAACACPETGICSFFVCSPLEHKEVDGSFVWEPVIVKRNALQAATEAACLILSVDETVRNPASEQEQGMGRGRGMGRGMPMGGMRGRGRGMMR